MDWYLPGYKAGGPIKSLSNLVEKLGDNFEFLIVTRDHDFGERIPYPDITYGTWNQVGNAKVRYLSKSELSRRTIRRIICDTSMDGIYFNSFFSWWFTLFPLMSVKKHRPEVPIFLAPRGMLGSGALGIKPFKKDSFIRLAKLMRLYSNVTWHVSSSREAAEVRKVFGAGAKTHIAANILRFINPRPQLQLKKKSGNAKFIFVSRIAQKKNLLNAVEWLGQTNLYAEFDAYGPMEDEAYYDKCVEASLLYPKLTFQWKGSIEPALLPEVFQQHHFFLMPTYNENFGHAIIEAMSLGMPIIISDQTPWRNLRRAGVGYDLPLDDPQGFIDALRECINMNEVEYDKMAARASNFAREYLKNSTEIRDHKTLFQKM